MGLGPPQALVTPVGLIPMGTEESKIAYAQGIPFFFLAKASSRWYHVTKWSACALRQQGRLFSEVK